MLPALGLDKPRDRSNILSQSQSQNEPGLSSPFLANPVLTFVKAFRLKGDTSRLSSLLAARFSVTLLVDALKDLWRYCNADLIRLDFTYHARRSSDPVQLFNTVLSDLL